MKKIAIKNFKAFKYTNKEFEIDLQKRHLLLYGDNGAGKSSLYEALKVAFCKDKLQPKIPAEKTPEEKVQLLNDFWNGYVSKHSKMNEFEIKINGLDYKEFDSSKYQLHMLSNKDLYFSEYLQWDELLEKVYFNKEIELEFYFKNYEVIQTNINKSLKEDFREDFTIDIDPEDDFKIRVRDEKRNLEYKKGLKKYFNEAKLNLVVLLLVFESMKIQKDDSKKNILVLDDFITSLDTANRTFMARYLFKNFEGFQIVLLTHNIYFYNLVMHMINAYYRANNMWKKEKWKFATLYEIDGEHKVYIKDTTTLADIRREYKATTNIQEIGNKVRQRFEELLCEIAKRIGIEAVESSRSIIDKITSSSEIFIKCDELIKKIEKIVSKEDVTNLKTDIEAKIEEYKYSEFEKLKYIVASMKLYQKVTLHPMSHGKIGKVDFAQKELETAMDLVEELEKILKSLKE